MTYERSLLNLYLKTYVYILSLWPSYDNFIKLVKIYFAIRNFLIF